MIGSSTFFAAILAWYEKKLDFVLRHRTATLFVACATLLLTCLLYLFIPKGFFPVQDCGLLQGIAEAPQQTSFHPLGYPSLISEMTIWVKEA